MSMTPLLHAQTYQEKIVAAILVAEASSEGTAGMLAVAEVIRQRALESSRTPLRVVTAKRAFSSLNGSTLDRFHRRWSQDENYSRALQIAAVLVRDPAKLGNRTNRANHFTLKTEKPYWARGKKPVAVIGQHAFYRL